MHRTLRELTSNNINYIKDFQILFSDINTMSQNHIFEGFNFLELGMDFFYRYADFPLRSFFSNYWDYLESTAGGELDPTSIIEMLGDYLYRQHGSNWDKVHHAYFGSEYNPIENYSMSEVRTPNLTITSNTERKQDTRVATSNESSVVPWNSTTATKVSSAEGSTATTEASEGNQIATTSRNTGTETLTRSGNIGVTTSQQMLEAELSLRRLNFVNRVFEDIAKTLFRDYYATC